MSAAWVHHRERRGDGEYRLDLGTLEIVVHRYIHDPGKWYFSCTGINVSRAPLLAVMPGDACEEAHRRCIGAVQGFQTALGMWDPGRLVEPVKREADHG